MSMSHIAKGNPRSWSFSMIQSPPGTGKKMCIVNLVGALIHHGNIGHIGCFDRYNLLKRKNGILRCAKEDGVER